MYEGKVYKVLNINKLQTLNEKDKTFKVLNRGSGDYVRFNVLKPLFTKVGNIKLYY